MLVHNLKFNVLNRDSKLYFLSGLLETQINNSCILHSSPRRRSCGERSIEEIGLGLKVEKLTSEKDLLSRSIG